MVAGVNGPPKYKQSSMFRRVDSGTTPQFELPIQHPPTHPTRSASAFTNSQGCLDLDFTSTHSPCTPHFFIDKYNYRQRPELEQQGGTVTSGKWTSVFLRLFHGLPVAQFHCHTWTSKCRWETGRVPSVAGSLFRVPQYSAVSAWFGWASSRLSQVAVCCVAGAAGAGVHVHVRLTLTLTLRPQHAPSHTWHRASVRQLCNCTSPAPGEAPLPLSATRRPQKQGLSAPPALHINTPPSSLPVCPRPIVHPHHHLRQS